jgi:hypothetical protein
MGRSWQKTNNRTTTDQLNIHRDVPIVVHKIYLEFYRVKLASGAELS